MVYLDFLSAFINARIFQIYICMVLEIRNARHVLCYSSRRALCEYISHFVVSIVFVDCLESLKTKANLLIIIIFHKGLYKLSIINLSNAVCTTWPSVGMLH